MQIARWGNSLAIRIPSEFVRRHDLKEGDSIELIEDEAGTIRLVTRQHWLDQVERLRRPLPDDWKDWKADRDNYGMRAAEMTDEERAALIARDADTTKSLDRSK